MLGTHNEPSSTDVELGSELERGLLIFTSVITRQLLHSNGDPAIVGINVSDADIDGLTLRPVELHSPRFVFRLNGGFELLLDHASTSHLLGDILGRLHRIHQDFTYRSGSTTVSTKVTDVLTAREGVCQDFARLAIACLRANGLAASYVSGYLATDPPPGKERMIGIDATHAWTSVWTPQNQWLGLDPTNDQMVDERYIVVGLGRDYADVPPLRGIIYTDSESSVIDVSVDVVPFDGDVAHA